VQIPSLVNLLQPDVALGLANSLRDVGEWLDRS